MDGSPIIIKSTFIKCNPRMIRYHLKELVDKKYVTRIGANKKGKWKIEIDD